MITISGVEITSDFAFARVFYTILGTPEDCDSTKSGLMHASGFLRTALGKRLRIHNIPELRFTYDLSIERGVRLTQLIDRANANNGSEKEQGE